MHLLPVATVSLDEGEAAVDLGQPPGDVVVLSFADSDLAALARAHGMGEAAFSLRLASLRRLRHPLSVDLYLEKTVARARFVLIRCLGGLDYWRYGVEQAAKLARARGIALAVLPGDDRPDPRLPAYATLSPEECDRLEAYFRAGGVENMGRLLAAIGAKMGSGVGPPAPSPVPRAFAWTPQHGPEPAARALARFDPARPLAHLLVYRSGVLAGDTAAVEALSEALRERGVEPLVLAVSSLKDPDAVAVLEDALRLRRPDVILSTTAFAARDDAAFVLDRADCPVLQAIPVGVSRAAWAASSRGLSAADLAMQVALPEADGRLAAGVISFKVEADPDPSLAFALRRVEPDPEGVAAVAERAAAWIRLARTPRALRRLALVLSDYPARGGRAGFAVGLDTPESARAIADLLAAEGYAVARDWDGPELMRRLTEGPPGFEVPLAAYRAWFETLPAELRRQVTACWGEPEEALRSPDAFTRQRQKPAPPDGDPTHPLILRGWLGTGQDLPPTHLILRSLACEASRRRPPEAAGVLETSFETQAAPAPQDEGLGWDTQSYSRAASQDEGRGWDEGLGCEAQSSSEPAFRFRAVRSGRLLIALQPDRGRGGDRKAGYHDPETPPSHLFLAFALGLREIERVDALIHLGTHGSTEWLPGKAAALSESCWPRLATGALPVIYPYIVDDPGEAAPAKRRLGALTLGHLTPPVTTAELGGEAAALKELVEELSSAQVLDPRRAALVAAEIRDRAQGSGLAEACGVESDTPMDEALARLDAHLCDIGAVTSRDGLHVFGEARAGYEACGEGERQGLIAALDGRFVPPGPSGSPSRGRLDVLPTGRNLSTFDPRAIPTRAATELGARAADEVVRRHLQEEGDWPRRVVMDLWASPTLRTGGEDIAHALALMGVRPVWDPASTRVTGFEIVPQPFLDRPRADVTLRVSGAFRDTFPEQIALLDQAARAVAALDEEDEWNALAAARRRGESLARVYGSAPGTYGAGVSALALDGEWRARADLGHAYLASTSHAYGAGGSGREDGGFGERVAGADAFVHVTDAPERDILDGDAVADAVGGFAAAAEALGARPLLLSVDASRPEAVTARTLLEDVDRLVRGRLAHPRWIAAQLRHGWRGAAEIAQGVDALAAFAATTDAVGAAQLDLVFAALLGEEATRERLRVANPAAARAIEERLADLLRRGLWTTRLNSAAALLAPPALAEAAE